MNTHCLGLLEACDELLSYNGGSHRNSITTIASEHLLHCKSRSDCGDKHGCLNRLAIFFHRQEDPEPNANDIIEFGFSFARAV